MTKITRRSLLKLFGVAPIAGAAVALVPKTTPLVPEAAPLLSVDEFSARYLQPAMSQACARMDKQIAGWSLRQGDTIMVNNEVMLVTGECVSSDCAISTLTVERGL